MSDVTLPAPIQAFVDATDRADSEGFLNAFTADATLDDWGRTFTGRDGIGPITFRLRDDRIAGVVIASS